MMLIRRFEEEAGRQYQKAKAGGFLHLAIGEEATIVGTTSVMRPEDYLIGTYRTHGHAIARGTDPKRVMAELFGRVDGTSGGRGGSMHIFDLEHRFMGGYGIVGGNLPLAAGLGLASDYKGEDEVTVCMFGDGASNTGNFGETMNLAALWSLPVVFLVENNLYGMGTSLERHSAVTDLSQKAEGMRRPGRAGRRHGRARGARDRRRAHPDGARGPQADAWSRRSPTATAATPRPIPRSTARRRRSRSGSRRTRSRPSRRRLVEEKVLTEDDVQELRDEADRTVTEAVEFADASPEPPLDSLYDHLYVSATRCPAGTPSTSAPPTRTRARRSATPAERAQQLAEEGAAYAGPGGEDAELEEAEGDRARDTGRRRRTDGDHADARGARDAMARGDARDERRLRAWARTSASSRGPSRSPRGCSTSSARSASATRRSPRTRSSAMGVGAAMAGLRPIVEIMTVNFALLAMDHDRQPRRRDPLHVRRPGPGAAGDPDAGRRRPPARPDPLPQPRGDVPADPRACWSPAPRPPPTARAC